MSFFLKDKYNDYSPETLGLGSASPFTDENSPVVELLSTPPRRGRRWLTDTCSIKEVPYLRKYHHSNIWGCGQTVQQHSFYCQTTTLCLHIIHTSLIRINTHNYLTKSLISFAKSVNLVFLDLALFTLLYFPHY